MKKEIKITPTPEWSMPGQRKHNRIDLNVPVKFRIVRGNIPAEDSSEGQLMDISVGGLMMCTKTIMNVGDLLEVEIDLHQIIQLDNDNQEIELRKTNILRISGKVKQVKERLDNTLLYGIKYIDIIEGKLDILEKLIDKYV